MLRGTTKPLVVSFPKSGRTWLRVMLDELGVAADYTHAGSSDLEHRTVDRIHPPDALLHGRKVIFMHRDPRDTLVSDYFQATKRRAHFKGSLSDFIRDPRYGIEKCVRFNAMWLTAVSGQDGVCVVSYEGLHRDTVSEMRRVLTFLEASITDADLARAVENCRFENMQRQEASGELAERYRDSSLRKFDSYVAVRPPRDLSDIDTYKVRRGKIGGWKDYLSAEDAAYCEPFLLMLPR